jgi:hypothetical protein
MRPTWRSHQRQRRQRASASCALCGAAPRERTHSSPRPPRARAGAPAPAQPCRVYHLPDLVVPSPGGVRRGRATGACPRPHQPVVELAAPAPTLPEQLSRRHSIRVWRRSTTVGVSGQDSDQVRQLKRCCRPASCRLAAKQYLSVPSPMLYAPLLLAHSTEYYVFLYRRHQRAEHFHLMAVFVAPLTRVKPRN